MSSVVRFMPKQSYRVFDDRTTTLVGAAFDAACREMTDFRKPIVGYEVLARRIIEHAIKGERDPVKLKDAALAALNALRPAHSP